MKNVYIGDITRPGNNGFQIEIPTYMYKELKKDPYILYESKGGFCYFWDIRPPAERNITEYKHIQTYIPTTNKTTWGMIDFTKIKPDDIKKIENAADIIEKTFTAEETFFGPNYKLRYNLITGIISSRIMFIGRLKKSIKIYTSIVNGTMNGIIFDCGFLDAASKKNGVFNITISKFLSEVTFDKSQPSKPKHLLHSKFKPRLRTLKISYESRAEKYDKLTEEYAKKIGMKAPKDPRPALSRAYDNLRLYKDKNSQEAKKLKKYIKLIKLRMAAVINRQHAEINKRIAAKIEREKLKK